MLNKCLHLFPFLCWAKLCLPRLPLAWGHKADVDPSTQGLECKNWEVSVFHKPAQFSLRASSTEFSLHSFLKKNFFFLFLKKHLHAQGRSYTVNRSLPGPVPGAPPGGSWSCNFLCTLPERLHTIGSVYFSSHFDPNSSISQPRVYVIHVFLLKISWRSFCIIQSSLRGILLSGSAVLYLLSRCHLVHFHSLATQKHARIITCTRAVLLTQGCVSRANSQTWPARGWRRL